MAWPFRRTNVRDLPKNELLVELTNNTRVLRRGHLDPMSAGPVYLHDADQEIAELHGRGWVEYFGGRPIKVFLLDDEIDFTEYNKDCPPGVTGAKVVKRLRRKIRRRRKAR